MSRIALIGALLTLAMPGAAAAANLVVGKTATVVSDPVGSAAPKSLPGAVVDYKVVLTNPVANTAKPVRNIVIEDQFPANVVLRVSDIGTAGAGPVEFVDGGVIGLFGSGLSCAFASLGSSSDCIDFSSDGVTWGYTPAPDADGYDANVRAIRLKPVTTFATAGSFQLRYRTKIK